ncbi:Nif11-like leader peptide family natural product precursor [Merismopedia glauca]|uniref:Nif11-like leader peptide family natural product n=1 Tax=Merismopedia glauca CCAP 1448/3 TaxID=1296344 RepID=A0A2T1C0W5_9CYAN|nr:Nif11-like leader peptide family natural product precursor [Merismopedia glauca]PSB01900.1 Nif11-like leader peptide family natural product precursor [Merismopedia glauca CCAP 1448/3]
MTQESAAKFFKAVKQNQALQERCEAIANRDTFLKAAEEKGYHFSHGSLEIQLEKIPSEEVAAMNNPGVGLRCHIVPR